MWMGYFCVLRGGIQFWVTNHVGVLLGGSEHRAILFFPDFLLAYNIWCVSSIQLEFALAFCNDKSSILPLCIESDYYFQLI